MNGRAWSASWVLLLLVALVATAAWLWANHALGSLRATYLGGTLITINTLVEENQALIRDLEGAPFAGQGNGTLESYLISIRRDGVAKNAAMKQRLDMLAENNTAVVTLLNVYASSARTPGFTAQANKFRSYAAAWRDRWNSVMELFMAGGNYAEAGPAFPSEFPSAIQSELAAALGE